MVTEDTLWFQVDGDKGPVVSVRDTLVTWPTRVVATSGSPSRRPVISDCTTRQESPDTGDTSSPKVVHSTLRILLLLCEPRITSSQTFVMVLFVWVKNIFFDCPSPQDPGSENRPCVAPNVIFFNVTFLQLVGVYGSRVVDTTDWRLGISRVTSLWVTTNTCSVGTVLNGEGNTFLTLRGL